MQASHPPSSACSQPGRSARQLTRWALLASAGLAAGVGLRAGVASARAPEPEAACRLDTSTPPTPAELFGELFTRVQRARLFEDQKLFADAVPLENPALIMERFAASSTEPGFDLRAFVESSFALPVDAGVTPPPALSLAAHIDWLWPELTRTTTSVPANGSLLSLPKPYVVPGGRFREVYYWDSYFTMLGLASAGQTQLVFDMLENFADEIDRFGHVPNGNRTYYLSRSQPPFFSHMVELAARLRGEQVYATYLPELRRELAYWMAGADETPPGSATAHVVVLSDGTVLNRYWDARDTPREESWLADVETAESAVGRAPSEVYRDLRAAAESGWDFSSRWLDDPEALSTIRTTSIVPVDLNSLLYHLEQSIVHGCRIIRDRSCVEDLEARAAERARAIEHYLWNEPEAYYADYDVERAEPRAALTAAALFPSFVGVASAEHERATARAVEARLLEPGGLVTTEVETGQQWDAPNGWAPLQWVAVEGLARYGDDALAEAIGTRFLDGVMAVFAADGKLVEKYDVQAGLTGGGGEYPLQDGFGWTNGVTLLLLDRYAGAPEEAPATEVAPPPP
jgi:alpha,alpha-trehalase